MTELSREWLNEVCEQAKDDGATELDVWWDHSYECYIASWDGWSLEDQFNLRYEDEENIPKFREDNYLHEFTTRM